MYSKKLSNPNINGFLITPISFGSSGHKSLTSKINLLPLKIFAIIPGIYRSPKEENNFPFQMIIDGKSRVLHF